MVYHVLRYCCMALLLVVAASVVAADDAESLYQAELGVASKDEASRDDNLRRALTMVLGRVVTRDDMASKPVGSMLLHPANFVDEFEYLSAKDGSTGDLMRVRFDEEAILRALQRSGMGAWGARRPEIVIWLWTQDQAGRQLVILHESPQFERPLASAAAIRRLPWSAPLGDLTDRSNLGSSDAESGIVQRIREATWRYESDFALVGELRRAGDQGWDANWRFVGPAGSDSWQARALEVEAVSTAGIDGAYDRLVKLYAHAGRNSATVELEVEGISSMQDADRCGAYLRSLPSVLRADWLKADANRATWRLTVAGRPEGLAKVVSGSRAVRPVGPPGTEGSVATYRWVP